MLQAAREMQLENGAQIQVRLTQSQANAVRRASSQTQETRVWIAFFERM